jgi:hypothetical protein
MYHSNAHHHFVRLKIMKPALALVLLAASGFGQVYTTTVTAGGSGYTSNPSVTASGGGCTVEPTFTASLAAGSVNNVTPTFMGTGCTSAPVLAISGGGGSGATATAVLLPATIVIISVVPSATSSGVQPTVSGSFLAWQFACWLTVPRARVPFYATNTTVNFFRMPGTAQVSQINAALANVPSAIATAMTNGILTEFVDFTTVSSSEAITVIEANVIAACSQQQTSLNNWNPWAFYGSYYNNGVWTSQGVL